MSGPEGALLEMKRLSAFLVASMLVFVAARQAQAESLPSIQIWIGPNQLSPGDTVTMPDQVPGKKGYPVSFDISNAGTADLILEGRRPVSVSGSGAEQFSVAVEPSLAVPSGEDTSFALEFNPVGTGSYSVTVSVSSNDPDTPTFRFTIAGRGVPSAPAK